MKVKSMSTTSQHVITSLLLLVCCLRSVHCYTAIGPSLRSRLGNVSEEKKQYSFRYRFPFKREKEVLVKNGFVRNLFFDRQDNDMVEVGESTGNAKVGSKVLETTADEENIGPTEGYMGDLVKLLKGENEESNDITIDMERNNDKIVESTSLANIIGCSSIVVVAAAVLTAQSLGIRYVLKRKYLVKCLINLDMTAYLYLYFISSLYSVPEMSVVIESVQNFFADPTSTLEAVLDRLNILAK